MCSWPRTRWSSSGTPKRTWSSLETARAEQSWSVRPNRWAPPTSVHFLGHHEEISSILRALDVGALSSDSEGTPIFVMECMAYGVPVVSTDVGGLRDLVEPDVTGVLVPPQDPPRLAAAIAELLQDSNQANRLAAASAARLPELTLPSVAIRFERLYASAVAEARGSG